MNTSLAGESVTNVTQSQEQNEEIPWRKLQNREPTAWDSPSNPAWGPMRADFRAEITELRAEMRQALEEKDRLILQLTKQLQELQSTKGSRVSQEELRPTPPTTSTPAPTLMAYGAGDSRLPYREPGSRDFPVRFGGEPSKLSFFLNQVADFFSEYGHTFPSETAKVRFLSARLEGPAADWVVELHNAGGRELQSIPNLMQSLRDRFEDPFRRDEAIYQLQQFHQGKSSVADYARKFRELVAAVPEWPEETRIVYFQQGLNPTILERAILRDEPTSLLGWIRLAGDVEAKMRSVELTRRHQEALEWVASKGRDSERQLSSNSATGRRKRSGLCFNCEGRGHVAANCPSRNLQATDQQRPLSLHQKPPMTTERRSLEAGRHFKTNMETRLSESTTPGRSVTPLNRSRSSAPGPRGAAAARAAPADPEEEISGELQGNEYALF